MPRRVVPLVAGGVYHVFNRGIDRRNVFYGENDYRRFWRGLGYFSLGDRKLSFSNFLRLKEELQFAELAALRSSDRGVKLWAYSLMPNHFHVLVKQSDGLTISKFMADLGNSYTRYFNVKRQRKGVLFETQFKAVRVTSEEYLLHLSRYIHLNLLTAGLVSNMDELVRYPWCSLGEYVSERVEFGLCDVEPILSIVDGKEEYMRFVADRADYQRSLAKIKKLLTSEVLIW